MRPLAILFALLSVPAAAQERVTFTVPEPISAYSGGSGTSFYLPLSIPVPFAADERPDLVIGSATAPNPAYATALAAQQAANAAYRAAQEAYERNQAARAAAQHALNTVYPGLLAAYEASHATWRVCRRQSIVPCGSEPRRPARPRVPAALPIPQPPSGPPNVPETIDTRTGPIVDFDVAGVTTTTLEFWATLGTLNPSLSYDLSLVAPDPVPMGAPITLRAEGDLRDGRIGASSPTYRVLLSQTLRIDRGEMSVGGCAIPVGCAETDRARVPPGEATIEILEITPAGTVFFGQTLPERYLRAGMPGLELEVTASLNLDLDDPMNPFGISVNGVSIPPEVTVGISTEAATGRLQFPVLELEGALDDRGVIRGSATSDFVSLDIDVDTATQLIGGASLGNDFVSVGADLWDVTAGPRLRPYQTAEMRPDLALRLDFDPAVEMEGRGRITQWSGAPDDIPPFRLQSETRVTPTWAVSAPYRSTMGLGFLAEIEIELIIAELNLLSGSVEYGPFAPEIPVMATDMIEYPLSDQRFRIGSFTPHVGSTLVLTPAD
jgi:hypothetical protein